MMEPQKELSNVDPGPMWVTVPLTTSLRGLSIKLTDFLVLNLDLSSLRDALVLLSCSGLAPAPTGI